MFPQSPGAFAVTLGSFSVSWYGICMAFAVLAGFVVVNVLVKKNSLNEKDFFNILLFILFFGFIGARLYHVWNEWWWYQNHISDIWRIWEGGLALHGGILFGFITLYVLAKIKKITLITLCDVLAPGMILAQAVGRWGNYFNEELFGKPFKGLFALPITLENRPEQFLTYETFYPLFLYEFILNIVIFAVLFIAIKKHKVGTGIATAIYLMGYSCIRFSLDFLRFDQFGFWGLSLAQWVSACLFVLGVILFVNRLQIREKSQRAA